MEITRNNFKDSLPMVETSIKKADFIAIDAEFTGLTSGRDGSIFDTPQEYYLTLLNGSTEFLLIQFGLCTFHWNEEEKRYRNEAFNFYLFPRGRPGPEKIFLCQSSSLDFLAGQGFDFNKLIREGISYMTEPVESKLRDNLVEKQKTYNSSEKESIAIPEENKTYIDEICNKVQKFLENDEADSIEFDRCNAFIRRLLFQEIRLRFKDQVFVETKILDNANRVLKVSKLTSANESKDKYDQRKEKDWEEFENAVGFSKVARMISQSEKLVIGHNMLLDVLHTLNHFFQPLPSDYESFKEFANCMFPRLLDTKYMSSLPPFKDKVVSSVLPHLLKTLSEPPFSLPKIDADEGRGYSRADDKQHEAGYDAYITGLCFLSMHDFMARMRGDGDRRVLTPDSALLKPFLNKLFLAKTAHQDSPYMNLSGADPTPSREHVFHLTFPREWQRTDINQLFSAYGQITVQFLDDTTALVALSRKDLAKTVARVFAKNKRITLVPYLKYKELASKVQKQAIPKRKDEPTQTTKVNHALKLPDQVTKNTPGNDVTRSVDQRPRSNSTNVSSTTTSSTRKRASSGVFQVEEGEPPQRRPNLSDSEENSSRDEKVANGRRKNIENENIDKAIGVFERSERRAERVSAFKESDSWD